MNESNNNYWTKVSAIATAIAALFSGVAMLVATNQFKTSLTESKAQFDKSLSKTDSSIVIAREQFEFSKRQSDDAAKEAAEQNRLQKLQFEKQLNELKRQSNASIKQIDYQIKAQRPYLVVIGKVLHKEGDSYDLEYCFFNKSIRPATDLKTRFWLVDSTYEKIIYRKWSNSTGVMINDVGECISVDDANKLQYMKISYYYLLLEYRDVITNEKFTQSFCSILEKKKPS